MYKKRDARAKLLFYQSKPIAFLPLSLPSPSSLLSSLMFAQKRLAGNSVIVECHVTLKCPMREHFAGEVISALQRVHYLL